MKKTIILLIITLIILFAGFVYYSSSKVTTFEKCIGSWLNREIVLYDYLAPESGQLEESCKL